MERMSDILARTVSHGARLSNAAHGQTPPASARTSHNTHNANDSSNATPPRPPAGRPRPATRPLADSRAGARGRALPTPASSGSRRLTPRLLVSRTGTTGSASTSGPLHARPTTPANGVSGDALEAPAPASTAAAAAGGVPRPRPADAAGDTLASDRILELPPRRTTNSGGRSTEPLNAANTAGDSRASDPAANPASAVPATAARPTRSAQMREGGTAYATRGAHPLASTRSATATPGLCPVCGGAGYVRLDVPLGDPAFGKPVPCECKERQIEERRRSDLRRMSSLDPFLDKTFDSFDSGVQGAHEAFEAARSFAADPEGWIVLSGTHGVGKTHLAAAIANTQLAQGTLVFFSIVPDLLDHLRAAFAPSSEVPYDEMFDKVREAGLLVLDDLGAENSTAWATEKLFQLINYRYNFRMPTVVTTNTRLLSHMDERIRSRLSDIGLVRHVAIKAQDYRERHVENRRRATGAPRTGSGPAPRRSS